VLKVSAPNFVFYEALYNKVKIKLQEREDENKKYNLLIFQRIKLKPLYGLFF